MAERVAVLDRGALQQFATAEELYGSPRNLFVASFIGDPPMNLLEGRYQVEHGKGGLVAPGWWFELPEAKARAVQAAKADDLVLGVRPQDLELRTGEAAERALQGRVILTEPLGAGTLVHVQVGDATIRALLAEEVRAAVGEAVTLTPRADRLHLFRRETGERV